MLNNKFLLQLWLVFLDFSMYFSEISLFDNEYVSEHFGIYVS